MKRMLPAMALGLLLGLGQARAELPDPIYRQAEATVRQYAKDMTQVVPCAYATMVSPNPDRDMVDSTWGPGAAHEALDGLAAMGATPEQIGRLRQVLHEAYQPVWAVADIRRFGRACAPVLQAATMFNDIATPLSMRPPFVSH